MDVPVGGVDLDELAEGEFVKARKNARSVAVDECGAGGAGRSAAVKPAGEVLVGGGVDLEGVADETEGNDWGVELDGWGGDADGGVGCDEEGGAGVEVLRAEDSDAKYSGGDQRKRSQTTKFRSHIHT